MFHILHAWLSLKLDRRAVTSLEYGLIAAIVVGVALVGFSGVGTNVAVKMNKVKNVMG